MISLLETEFVKQNCSETKHFNQKTDLRLDSIGSLLVSRKKNKRKNEKFGKLSQYRQSERKREWESLIRNFYEKFILSQTLIDYYYHY